MTSPSPEKPNDPKSPPPRLPKRPPSGDEQPRGSSFSWFSLLLILAVLFGVFLWMRSPGRQGSRVAYSFFEEQLRKNNVEEVTFHGDILTGKWKTAPKDPDAKDPKSEAVLDGAFNTRFPERAADAVLAEMMAKDAKGNRKYDVKVKSEEGGSGFGTTLFLWLLVPLIVLGLFLGHDAPHGRPHELRNDGQFHPQPRRNGSMPPNNEPRSTTSPAWNRRRSELQEVVEFLKNPAKFQRLGARSPRACC